MVWSLSALLQSTFVSPGGERKYDDAQVPTLPRGRDGDPGNVPDGRQLTASRAEAEETNESYLAVRFTSRLRRRIVARNCMMFVPGPTVTLLASSCSITEKWVSRS